MAKMLMGQIDHARDRIKELTQLKLDEKPETPSVPDTATFLTDIRQGKITLTPAKLKSGLRRFIDQTPIDVIKPGNSRWNHRSQSYNEDEGYQDTVTPSSIDEAIRDEYYAGLIANDVNTFNVKMKAYQVKKDIITTKAKEVEDYIVLGDVHTALVALQEFEAFEV